MGAGPPTTQGGRGKFQSPPAPAAPASQPAAARQPATMITCPPGTAAAPCAVRSSSASPSPDPAASNAASPGTTQERASVTTSPGTTMAPRGIAIRLASTPIGATVPNAYAVIGAVSRVAAGGGGE